MLSTAELLLGLSRHLRAYATSSERLALDSLEQAGRTLDLAVKLRGSGTSTPERVSAIAGPIGSSKRDLRQTILPTLQGLGLVDVVQNKDNEVVSILERIPPLETLLMLADSILDSFMPDPVERASLHVFDKTVLMPITPTEALHSASAVAGDADCRRALEYLEALHLCKRQRSADGVEVVYNPNIWSSDKDYSYAALQAEDGQVRAALTELLEEVAQTAGIPQESVTAKTDMKWINFAVTHGLLLRSLVRTNSGTEKAFLFAPHMGSNAFEEKSGADPSGNVRQLIGSMAFARTYASNRLFAPSTFLRKLVREGEAGDASSIATDYPMLEQAGIIRVEPADNYHKFVLLQADIAEAAITYLEDVGSGSTQGIVPDLQGQQAYNQPEHERAVMRAEIGRSSEGSPLESDRLIAALRQEFRRHDNG